MLIRKNSFLSSASLAVMALSLSAVATPAFAGFEWTPPEKTAPAPLPPAQAEPSQIPMDSSALPEVGDFEVPAEEQPAPQQEYQPPQSGKLKVIEVNPQREQIPVNEQEPQEQAPVVMSAPVTPDDSANSANQATPEPFPLTETHQGQDAILPAPAPGSEPAPAAESAPTGLSINPYPLEGGEAAPPAEVAAPTPQDQINWQGGYEVLEGFGSDMPLALALQQVVPPQYAFSFGSGVNAGHLVSWEGGKPWDQVLNDMISPLNLQARISGNVVKIVSKNAPATPQPVAQPDQGAALEPLPALEPAPAQEQAAAEELNLEPVTDSEAKKIAKEAKAVQDKAEIAEAAEQPAPAPVEQAKVEPQPEPQGKKVSKSRNVITDPGESKPLEPANKIVKKSSEKASQSEDAPKQETAKILAPAPEAAPPSEAALESAKTEPASQQEAASPQLSQPRIWEAKRGSSLKDTLDSWSKQANVTLNWQAQDDVKLNSDILISGTFDNAIKVLFAQAVKKGPGHTLKTDGAAAELVVADQNASG